MKKIVLFLIFTTTSFILSACGGNAIKPATGVAGDGRLDEIVAFFQKEYRLPALAAVMVHNDQIIEKSAVGRRSIKSNIRVTSDDQWHIGSNTKSMTSLLAALLIKNNYIRWDTTLSEVYPELADSMRPEYKNIRLDELLSHTAGMPANPNDVPSIDLDAALLDQRRLSIQRQDIVNKTLTSPSSSLASSNNARGEFNYSNMGYIIAGAMLEKVTGNEWESLMQTYIFNPLQMTKTGFGAPNTQGSLAQPVGHELQSSHWVPVDPFTEDDGADNLPLFGPAGTVHASLDDMAAYIGLHLKGLRGESVVGFLDSQTFKKLYKPVQDNYALGWTTPSNQVISHEGSNGLWLALMIIDAEKNTALYIVANADGNTQTETAIYKLLDTLEARAKGAFES